jgi:phospholipase C
MIKLVAALVAAVLTASCGSYSPPSEPLAGPAPPHGRTFNDPIKHVVFIVQENRSFNDLFMGYPGAKTATYGYNKKGAKVRLRPRGLSAPWDIAHSSTAFFTACDGTGSLPGTNCKMDGWSGETAPDAPKNAAYSYVPRAEVAPYWDIAKRYVLADHTFASNLDGSFISHQYIVAAFASSGVDFPASDWGCEGGRDDKLATLLSDRTDGPKIRACFDNPTIASEADAVGLSWRFYADTVAGIGGIWSSYQADRQIFRGPDWNAKVISPPAQFLSDVANGKLARVTWITPTWETSDHPGPNATQGPAWVASLVNAVGTSKFWDSTAIFVMWDDWGGFFDPVKPVFEDYDGLGFRVPLLMVSPYAKQHSVTHVQYETASVLRFIEDNFGLLPLAASDERAHDPEADPSAFDYRQRPRPFEPIEGAKPTSYWLQLERSAQTRERPPIIGDD